MVDPSGLEIKMKIKCVVCGFGIYQKDTEAFHLSETGHQDGQPNFLKMKIRRVHRILFIQYFL